LNRGNFFSELKRRNVIRAAILYVGSVWALAQGISQLGPSLGAPEWATRWFLVAAGIGFPFWSAFAWFYELTPEGLKRESEIDPAESIAHSAGRKLDFVIIGVLAVAVVLLLTDRLRHGVNEATALPIAEKSIAVLPFVDMSQAKDQEFFSDGISEELLNLLSKVPPLHVAARTSSFSFKGKQIEIPEIARQLHVANVLEGSVRKSGDQVRITAQLIHAADGFHLWSQTWDRKLDDIFKIQEEIAAEVVKELKVSLLGAAPKTRTTDPNAYVLYLQAAQLGRQHNAEAFEKSDALYRRALEIDPRYAPAWTGLGWNLTNRSSSGMLPAQEGYARAREAAEKALEIDPDNAPAHSMLGNIAKSRNDFQSAARHFERALALDGTNPAVVLDVAVFLKALTRTDEALALDEFQVRRDPVNVTALYNLGNKQSSAGRFDEAIASLRTALSLSPGVGTAHFYLCLTMLQKGDASGALAEIRQETNEAWRMVGLPMVYHALGREDESDAALAELIAKYEKDAAYNIAYVYAFRGDKDKAFEWLDKAVTYNDTGLSEIASEKNLFANVDSDPRWLPFLRKIGRAPEQLAKIQFKVILPQ